MSDLGSDYDEEEQGPYLGVSFRTNCLHSESVAQYTDTHGRVGLSQFVWNPFVFVWWQ